MNLHRENKLLWNLVDEVTDVIVAGVGELKRVSDERDQARKETDSLKRENQVLWEEVVAQQQLIVAQQQLIEEMRRVRAARARHGA